MSDRRECYTPTEDTRLCQMIAGDRPIPAIASAVGRTVKSVQQRIYILRRDGTIPGYMPRRPAVEDERAISLNPPLELRLDDELVQATLKQGGFPRIVQTSYGGVLAGPDGMPWRYGQPCEARA